MDTIDSAEAGRIAGVPVLIIQATIENGINVALRHGELEDCSGTAGIHIDSESIEKLRKAIAEYDKLTDGRDEPPAEKR